MIQIQHLLKLNGRVLFNAIFYRVIQIQHLLKLNINNIKNTFFEALFKYNTC